MYRVLIAEDEVFVRLGLKMSVEWEKMDMRVIADAANGQQAWDIYEKEHPDIDGYQDAGYGRNGTDPQDQGAGQGDEDCDSELS